MGVKRYPLWAVTVAGALIVGGLAMVREQLVKAISDPSQWTNASGAPLDIANDEMVCPVCGDWIVRQSGYEYRCRKCGERMQVKLDSQTGKFVWHR